MRCAIPLTCSAATYNLDVTRAKRACGVDGLHEEFKKKVHEISKGNKSERFMVGAC
jgi:hypothetical protein